MDTFEDEAQRRKRLFEGGVQEGKLYVEDLDGRRYEYNFFHEFNDGTWKVPRVNKQNPLKNPFSIFGGDEFYPRPEQIPYIRVGTAETMKPRAGYIDGGIILTKGFQLTHEMMWNAPKDEWQAFSEFVDRMANLVADEILPDRMYWVYDTVPVITTME